MKLLATTVLLLATAALTLARAAPSGEDAAAMATTERGFIDKVKDGAHSFAEKVKEGAHVVAEKASEVGQKIADAAKTAGGKVAEAAHNAKEAITGDDSSSEEESSEEENRGKPKPKSAALMGKDDDTKKPVNCMSAGSDAGCNDDAMRKKRNIQEHLLERRRREAMSGLEGSSEQAKKLHNHEHEHSQGDDQGLHMHDGVEKHGHSDAGVVAMAPRSPDEMEVKGR